MSKFALVKDQTNLPFYLTEYEIENEMTLFMTIFI